MPPQNKANKKNEHKIFALYLGVRGPGQRDTSRGPQAGARTCEVSTRLRKPPQRTAHPMTNRPQLIMQGCLRRVAPGPAPKKTFDNVCVWLGVGVHSRVVSERTPNRKQHVSRQQHTQGLLDLGAAGKTTKRDNRKTTDHLIAFRSVSHGTSFKKCAFLSEASSRLPGGHREPPSSPPGVSTHSTRPPSSPPGVSTHTTRLRSRPRLLAVSSHGRTGASVAVCLPLPARGPRRLAFGAGPVPSARSAGKRGAMVRRSTRRADSRSHNAGMPCSPRVPALAETLLDCIFSLCLTRSTKRDGLCTLHAAGPRCT